MLAAEDFAFPETLAALGRLLHHLDLIQFRWCIRPLGEVFWSMLTLD